MTTRKVKVGQRFKLVRDVERFPHFTAEKGNTGTVIDVTRDCITGKMDKPIPGAEDWDNEIQWFNDPPSDFCEDTEPC